MSASRWPEEQHHRFGFDQSIHETFNQGSEVCKGRTHGRPQVAVNALPSTRNFGSPIPPVSNVPLGYMRCRLIGVH